MFTSILFALAQASLPASPVEVRNEDSARERRTVFEQLPRGAPAPAGDGGEVEVDRHPRFGQPTWQLVPCLQSGRASEPGDLAHPVGHGLI